jgi:hypothetical protein
MDAAINPAELQSALASEHPPLVIDVRKSDAFRAASDMMAGALRRDPEAEFLYVPAGNVLSTAKDTAAIAYDLPDVAFSHDGELCSFDAFLSIPHER